MSRMDTLREYGSKLASNRYAYAEEKSTILKALEYPSDLDGLSEWLDGWCDLFHDREQERREERGE